jgi:hypothetical protein
MAQTRDEMSVRCHETGFWLNNSRTKLSIQAQFYSDFISEERKRIWDAIFWKTKFHLQIPLWAIQIRRMCKIMNCRVTISWKVGFQYKLHPVIIMQWGQPRVVNLRCLIKWFSALKDEICVLKSLWHPHLLSPLNLIMKLCHGYFWKKKEHRQVRGGSYLMKLFSVMAMNCSS